MNRVILVGGGSASGKTYVTNLVIKELGEENVTFLSLDDYYKDLSNIPFEERERTNYDHPKAFDWILIRSQIRELKEGKTIEKPIYDFVTHTRKKETELVTPKKIIIVEGIMALVDKEVREIGDIGIFINASGERRLLRRIIRDTNERGRSLISIINQYFATVQPMHDEIIEPSSKYADVIINNDGTRDLAADVLARVISGEVEIADKGSVKEVTPYSEFTEEALNKAFKK